VPERSGGISHRLTLDLSTVLANSGDMPPLPPSSARTAVATVIGILLAALAHPGDGSAAPATSAPEWPQFRGPDGNGISPVNKVPLRWSAEENIAWKTEVPGAGWSSPVLVQDKIFLTSAVLGDEESATLNTLCLEQKTGRVLWNREVFRPEIGEAKRMHRKNTAASPTPIVADGRIYVHFGHLGTAALDIEGNILWKQEGLKYTPVHGTGGSPALVQGLLIFSADGREAPFVAALDAQTGELRWKTDRNTPAKKNFSFSTPQLIEVNGQKQVVSPGSGFVAAYRPVDGSELWRVHYGEGYSVVPRPVFAHGLLYLSSGFDSAALYAIRPEGATGDATETHVAWTLKKGAPHTPSVLVVEDLLFCVSDAGIASCIEAKTGEVVWSERLSGNFSASPVYAGGRIYFQNETGSTFVVKPSRQYELLATNEIGERTLASLAPSEGCLFIRGEKYLYKVQ
jgi:outer membrane protein assembly factor BamB